MRYSYSYMSEQNPGWSDTMEGHVVNFIIHTVLIAPLNFGNIKCHAHCLTLYLLAQKCLFVRWQSMGIKIQATVTHMAQPAPVNRGHYNKHHATQSIHHYKTQLQQCLWVTDSHSTEEVRQGHRGHSASRGLTYVCGWFTQRCQYVHHLAAPVFLQII